jgi:amidase
MMGVAQESDGIPKGSLGKRGGAILYLPVFVDRALFAAGDLHAIQADEEACVSAVEVSGKLTLSFDVLRKLFHGLWKMRKAIQFWSVEILLDAACSLAVDEAVKALMRAQLEF